MDKEEPGKDEKGGDKQHKLTTQQTKHTHKQTYKFAHIHRPHISHICHFIYTGKISINKELHQKRVNQDKSDISTK